MSELKITNKEAFAVEYAGTIFIQDSDFYEDSESCNLLCFDYVGKEEAENNAKVYTDAHNTYNKCSLLPSELLDRNNELIEFINRTKGRLLDSDYKLAIELINKSTL